MQEKNTEVMVAPTNALPVANTDDIKFYGSVIQQSGILKCKTPAEGMAVFIMCRQSGMPIQVWNEKFHLIKGNITKKVQAMQADFQRAGGEIEIHSHTSELASATFRMGKTVYKSEVSWEAAKHEPFPYAGKEDEVIAAMTTGGKLTLKAKYATPHSRAQMLWARCVSDGVRVVYPAACEGVYTPEETGDFADDNDAPSAQTVVVNAVSPSPIAEPKTETAPVVPEVVSDGEGDIDIISIPGALCGKRYSEQPKATIEWALKSDNPTILNALTGKVRAHLESLVAAK